MLKNAYPFTLFMCVILSLSPVCVAADEENTSDETKELSGMSILGNSEAPKSLVIVPWKTSEIGDGIGVANMLDGRARPVDRDVFMRELGYYQLRVTSPQKQPQKTLQDAANAVAKQ